MESDVVAALKTITPMVFFIAPPVEIGEQVVIDGQKLMFNYPYIVYDEASDIGVDYADNVEIASEIIYNVSVINNDDTNTVANQVVNVMRSLGYERDTKHDLYQNGEYAKVMRFRGGKIDG